MFSIVTPSFRSIDWLPLCLASVADQDGVDYEHIVQDACSDDGTADLLAGHPRVRAFIEKDQGMYDAINRGLRRARGDILAHLNSDEQYLPGALLAVRDFFSAHPEVDVALGDSVVTDSDGQYICHRYSLVPGQYQMWVRFPVLTCSLFIRQRVVRELGIYCNTDWRELGDWVWIRDMVQRGVRFAVLPRFTSTFADTGDNLCLKPHGDAERRKKWQMAPAWVRLLRHAFVARHRLQLALRGANTQPPFDYAIYTRRSPKQRVTFQVAKPTSFWKGRSSALPQ